MISVRVNTTMTTQRLTVSPVRRTFPRPGLCRHRCRDNIVRLVRSFIRAGLPALLLFGARGAWPAPVVMDWQTGGG